MTINIRQKGQEGERQVAKALNQIINEMMTRHGIPLSDKPVVQRNQNQSAVGGNDLSNVFGISIEVKRQEQLSVNTWWQQCITAANENREFPVLIYRQNNKAWRVVMLVWAQLPAGNGASAVQIRAEMDWESFLGWFRLWVDRKLQEHEVPFG